MHTKQKSIEEFRLQLCNPHWESSDEWKPRNTKTQGKRDEKEDTGRGAQWAGWSKMENRGMPVIAEVSSSSCIVLKVSWGGSICWLVDWVMASGKHKMNNSYSEETGEPRRLWEMPQYASWSMAFVRLSDISFQPWLCTLILPRGSSLGTRLICVPCQKYLLWRYPCSRVSWFGFRKVEAVGEFTPSTAFSRWGNWGTDWDRGHQWPLSPPAFASCSPTALELGNSAPAAFLSQS